MNREVSYLHEAVRLAMKGAGRVEPNPRVGALVVKGSEVIARGYHRRYGGPHAEAAALKKAGERAAGAELYITLEPCSTQGKTPPCTEAVMRSGVRRVVVGAVDPDPRHGGAGLDQLRQAGIDVTLIENEACRDLLNGFLRSLENDKPHVILKWAMTLDGRIAARDGSSQWISGERSRRAVHRLRGHVDGVMVGSRTVVLDDPSLNCRLKGVPLVPARVVLDPRLEVPLEAGLIRSAANLKDEEGFPLGPVILFTSSSCGEVKAAGVETVHLDAPPEDEPAFLSQALVKMRGMGIHRLLVEGGGHLFTRLVEARLADQVQAYIAAKIVGGSRALSPVEGEGLAPMKTAHQLIDTRITHYGRDVMMEGFFPWSGSS